MSKEEKMCEGCMYCDPHSYEVTVDAAFLFNVLAAYETLQSDLPEKFAKGWMDELRIYIALAKESSPSEK